ncbi:MAG: hypothetical protein M3O01_07215 [Pseudomonadota bacterium]|nr:hypothetical protein [Pseudomonadota bacterium]
MSGLSVFIRHANGELTEAPADDALLAHCRALVADGITGRELIVRVFEVDPKAPPLSVRLAGVDATGATIEEFFCYA